MIRHALTIDLEEYFQVSNFEAIIDRSRWEGISSRVAEPTRRLLDAFEETGQRATFFVLGWIAERQPALVRHIAERGHEIACHGYGHELVYTLGAEGFRSDLRRARAAIEDACGARVVGYRAPSYSITDDSLWALEVLADEGFEFDSSIFPIRHHRYGIPGFSRMPVRLRLPSGRTLLEFPMTTLRVGPVNLPLAGGAYLRLLPWALFRLGLRLVERSGMPTVLYAHPWELDPGQPRQDVSWRVRFNHYRNLDKVEARLRLLLADGRFGPMGEVLDQLAAAGEIADWSFGPEGRESTRNATEVTPRATIRE